MRRRSGFLSWFDSPRRLHLLETIVPENAKSGQIAAARRGSLVDCCGDFILCRTIAVHGFECVAFLTGQATVGLNGGSASSLNHELPTALCSLPPTPIALAARIHLVKQKSKIVRTLRHHQKSTNHLHVTNCHKIDLVAQFAKLAAVQHKKQMNIRQTLKKSPLICRLWKPTYPARFAIKMARLFLYDYLRYIRYSKAARPTKESLRASIVLSYHIVEKGLTMPQMRLGFGMEILRTLLQQIHDYLSRYPEEEQIKHAIAVVFEYDKTHDEAGFELDEHLRQAIRSLRDRFPHVTPSEQIVTTRHKYFSEVDSPFDVFSSSRHSVRSFDGPVDIGRIESAIRLAANAPSFCNRQPCRVHVITDYSLVQQSLKLQNGNRGFGHLVHQLLVLTADLRTSEPAERNCIHLNSGIYLMNLCYSLHRYKVAHCMLNWSAEPENDRNLRKLLGIENEEHICVLLACGNPPETFSIAVSPKSSDSLSSS